MEMARLFGVTAGVIKESINMIKNMALGHFTGPMEENMSEVG